MKKRNLILIVAAIIIVAVLSYLGIARYYALFPFEKTDAVPVEPFVNFKQEESIFELKYYPRPDVRIFDVSISRDGTDILFGTDTKKVTLIDNEGNLEWERVFESDPLQTKISACGQYLGIGTSSGTLIFMKNNQEVIREEKLENPISHLALAPSGDWLVSGSIDEDKSGLLTYYNYQTGKEWALATGMILHLAASSDDQRIFYTEKVEDACSTVVLNPQGEELQRIDDSELRALSPAGNFFTVQNGAGEIVTYNNLREEMWRKKWGVNSVEVLINSSGNRMLIFDKHSDRKSNLHCYNAQGKQIWENFIAADALIVFSSDGRNIILSTGINQPKEGFSKIMLINENGDTDKEIELPVKVEKIIASPYNEIFVIGNDSSVYQVYFHGQE